LKKTLNIGDRLREAQNINTSLLVLGRCLKSIHEGQLTRTKTDAIGPFRESKLTRLFQRALSGKEHLALIVNINPLPNLYIETQNVLNFAAIAKKIIIEKKKEAQKKLKSRFSQIVKRSIQTVTDWDVTELESVDSQHADTEESSDSVTSEEYMDMINENERLKREITALKNSAIIRDFQSRQEMADKYVAMIKDLEVEWKQRINDVESQHEDALEWTVKQVEEFYERKLNKLHRKKRRRSNCSDDTDEDSDLNSTLQDLNRRNQQLKEKNDTLRKTVTELKITNETLIVEKNKTCFELGLLKEDIKVAKNLLEAAQKDICLNDDGKIYIEEMTSQLHAKDEQIKKLKEILNEAKHEYIDITSDLKKKELCIDEQAKIIIENEEKIEDLELQLEQTNLCLTEKTKLVETLEEKLEQQSEKLHNVKKKMQEEIDQLKNEKLELISQEATSTQNEYQEIIIKEELIIDDVSEDTYNIMKDTQIEMEKMITKNTETIDLSQTELTDNATSVSNIEPHLQLNTTYCKPLKLMVDVGCQMDIIDDKDHDTDHREQNVYYKSTQTSMTIEDIQNICDKAPMKEETVQTDEMMDEVKLQLKELNAQRDNIQAQYQQERSKVEKLAEKLRDVEETMQALKRENHSNKNIMDTLEEQLSLAVEEKRKMEETVQSCNMIAEEKIADYKREIDQLGKDLSIAKDNAQQYLENLEASQKELNNYMLKCEEQKEEKEACKLNEIVLVKEEIDDESQKQIDKQAEKVLELEKSLETIIKLKDNIVQLNENLETSQMEKDCIQKMLDKNDKKLLQLESRLQIAVTKEQEKDKEIVTLQKELKNMIQKNENTEKIDNMEAELKTTINDLKHTKQMLFQKEQYIKELKIHLDNFERSAKIFTLLETNAKERQIENERLRNVNEELRTTLIQKEHEMDAFMKNRDETVTKYETLVKNQQEELDREKREVMRYQELFRRQLTPTPNKDDYRKLQNRIETLQDRLQKYEINTKAKDDNDSTSDDESLARQPKRRGKKTVLTAKQEDIPVIELSGSEKRNTRRNASRNLPLESSTEIKRTTRRKKLFVDDSFADIEPENEKPAASMPTRSLRTRRK